jgi:hypothetical protein
MPSVLVTPFVSALDQANAQATRLAGAKTRLFKAGPILGPSTILADLDAFEADFDGYTPGGLTVPSWSVASLGPSTGAVVVGGTVNFLLTPGGPGITNVIAGFYLVTSDNVLWRAGSFDPEFPMQFPGVGFPVNWMLGFAAG